MKKFFDSLAGKVAIILICPVIVIAIIAVVTVITVNNLGVVEDTTQTETFIREVELPTAADENAQLLATQLKQEAQEFFPKVTTEQSLIIESVEGLSPSASYPFR